jgi:hypothetical protein
MKPMKTDKTTPRTDAMIASDQHHIEDDNWITMSCYWRMTELARELERELARLQSAINEFCEKHSWADERWKAQPHIKALFDLKGKNQ